MKYERITGVRHYCDETQREGAEVLGSVDSAANITWRCEKTIRPYMEGLYVMVLRHIRACPYCGIMLSERWLT